jgi:dTDP-4-dehydrorhamnose 3,5-epimerase
MNFKNLELKDAFVIELTPFIDDRGWFARTFCEKEFKSVDLNTKWVQMNHSFTKKKGTIRGMHFQLPPYNEIKLVRCLTGKVFDVIVDLRKNSETFLKWVGVELSPENKNMIYIPNGFAHGFQTLSDDVELFYLHSQEYVKESDSGIRFDDPIININWKLEAINISAKDLKYEKLNENFNGII